MKPRVLAAFLLFLLQSVQASEENGTDLAHKTRLIGEGHGLRRDSLFARGLPLTGFGRDRVRAEQELRGRAGPLALLVTGSVSGEEGRATRGKLLANEAYVDFGAGENRFSAGKKILSGDVGYGFRPIDVVQREARLQLLPPALEGVPHLAWERYSAESAWSVILANPGRGRRGEAPEDGSLALRHFRRAGGADWHGVARYSERFRLEAGAAVSAVPHESLELHGSFLQQQAGERTAPAPGGSLLAADGNLEVRRTGATRKALAGLTWTVESGWSLLGELWWDGTAPAAADWQRLAAQARARDALALAPGVPQAAITGALAASTRMFQQASLARRAALARIAWTDPAAGGWSASLDLLRSLDDGGYNLTAALGWQADRLRLDVGLRRFGGKPESAYRLFPERGAVFAGASLAF